jgi:hypothetical protein
MTFTKAESYHIAQKKRTIYRERRIIFAVRDIFPPRCHRGKKLIPPLIDEESGFDLLPK